MQPGAHVSGGDAWPPARGTFRLMFDRRFGLYFFGQSLSSAGVWLYQVAAALTMYDLTGSAALVGAVSAVQFLPQLLSPWSGAAADRGDRMRQILAGRTIVTIGAGALCELTILDVAADAKAAAILASALVVGSGFALGGPAMQALVPRLVRPAELAAAVTLSAVPNVVARAVGPMIAVALIVAAGPALAFGIAALTSLVFTAMLMAMRLPRTDVRVGTNTSVRAGWRRIRRDPALCNPLIAVVAVGLGADPAITLSPAIADSFGGDERLAGTLVSAFGVGAAAAFLMVGPLRRILDGRRMSIMGLVVFALGLTGVAVASSDHVAVMSFAAAGGGMTFSLTALTTLIQQRSEDAFRGRVMAFWALASLGSRPFAAGVDGALAELASPAVAIVVPVLALAGAAWAMWRGAAGRA